MFKGRSEKLIYVYVYMSMFVYPCIHLDNSAISERVLFELSWSTSHARLDCAIDEVKSIVQNVQVSQLQAVSSLARFSLLRSRKTFWISAGLGSCMLLSFKQLSPARLRLQSRLVSLHLIQNQVKWTIFSWTDTCKQHFWDYSFRLSSR